METQHLDVGAVVTAVVALLTSIYTVVVRLTRLETKMNTVVGLDIKVAQLELKAITVWDFLMRRAVAEGVTHGLLTVNSPIIVTEDAKLLLRHMASELQTFYRKLGCNLAENELMLAIEHEFGERLLKEVCIPQKLEAGACLYIAAHLAREPVDADTGKEIKVCTEANCK